MVEIIVLIILDLKGEIKMSEITEQNVLGTEKVGKLMLRYAVPSVISLVVNSLYNMVDQIFIGQGVGYLGNAATNVIQPLTTIMLAIGLMIGDGTAAYMSLNLGKGDKKTASRGVGIAITLTVGLSILFLILFECFATPLCNLFGATESTLPYALDYGRIIFIGFPFFAIASGFGSIIRADGRPKATMVGLLIGCIANIILDPVFIFVFKWGVKGAALATIIGQILNAIYFIACMFKFESIELKKQDLNPFSRETGKILSLGTASFITQIATVLVMAVMNNSLVKYGALSEYGSEIPLAALGITMKVNMLISSIVLGIATGVQPIMGYNYGNGQYSRVKQTYKYVLTVSTCVLAVAFIVFQTKPESIISLFGTESDLYMQFAVKCFRIFLLLCFTIGISCATGIFFQAIGKPIQSAVLSLARQVIFLIPSILILGNAKGVEGILWAGPISDGLACALSVIVVCFYWKSIFEGGKKNG